MRKYRTLPLVAVVTILVLLSASGYAGTACSAPCPDFFGQSPIPLDDWSEIASPSPNVAWVVSFGGLILKTEDGGQTWENQWSPVQYWRDTPPLYDISAPSNDVAWICSENGIVVMTADGGETWSLRSLEDEVDLKGICALNGSVAWAVGVGGAVFRTSNGGRSWTHSHVGGNQGMEGVSALSATNAWVSGGDTTVAVTTDGGANWTLKDPSDPPADIVSVKAFNNQRVYATGGSYFFSTDDGGATWDYMSFGSKITVMGMSFADGQNGWVCGTDNYNAGFITQTSDGGKNWKRQNPPQLNTERNMTSISTSSRNVVYASSVDGALLRTGDGGARWDRFGTVWTRDTLFGVSVVDNRSAWASGENGTILRTFNGGISWVTQPSHVSDILYGIDAVDSSTAWAVGENGTILKTTDYGSNWLRQSSGTDVELASVSSVSKSEAWACGSDQTGGYVLHTTDGGSHWAQVQSMPDALVTSIAAWDAKTVWFSSLYPDASYIYRTTDGGNHWEKVTVPRPISFQRVTDIRGLKPMSKDVCLAIVQTVAFVDNFTYMYRTSDGGRHWNKVGENNIFANGNLFGLATVDGRTIWSCGASLNPYAEPTVAYKTGNGGESWVNSKVFHRTVMFGIDNSNDGTSWMVGYTGSIFRSNVPSIYSISPDSADNIGAAKIADIAGSGFSDGMEVTLERGDRKIEATNVDVVSPYEATCEFNLDSAPVGAYDVVTKNINGMEDRLAEGFTVTTPTDWYLPEGSTGVGPDGRFETWVLVENPSDKEARVEITYMTPAGETMGPSINMAPESRQTVNVADTVPNEWSISARVASDRPVVVERAMYWDTGDAYRQSATGSVGLSHLSRDWYMAEGSTGIGESGSFETWVLVQNPGSEKAEVKITYLTPGGSVAGPNLVLEPGTRQTVNVADKVPNEWSVSTVVESNVPVAAEKAMYWSGGEYRQAALDSIGASGPSRTWYLAEGSTGSDYRGSLETWVLIENPSGHTARARLHYQLQDRQVEGPEVILEPYTRETVNVADTVPNEYSVSTRVVADGPVVAERSTYWNSGVPRQTATGSIGIMAPHEEWMVAEGSTGQDARGSFETWVLVQNPGLEAAKVKLTYMTPQGAVDGPDFKMPPLSRKSVSVAETVKDNWSVSTHVESDKPVVVDRAVYWSDISEFWRSAHSSCGYAPY